MPTGTPHSIKCPACKRGKYHEPRQGRGVERTGNFEKRMHRSSTQSYGRGRKFVGWRGEVKCLDCGHVWFSTLAGKRHRVGMLDG